MGAQAAEVTSQTSRVGVAALGAATVALSLVVALAGAPLPGDRGVATAIQGWPGFSLTAEAVNTIGDWQWAILGVAFLACLLAPRVRALAGARSTATTALALAAPLLLLDSALKLLIRSPRPGPTDGLRIDSARESYGFPSGHVYGDVVVLGLLFIYCPMVLPRALVMPARVVLVALLVLAGPSRVYVGAHWPSDTIGGYLWGALAFTVVVALTNAYERKR